MNGAVYSSANQMMVSHSGSWHSGALVVLQKFVVRSARPYSAILGGSEFCVGNLAKFPI